MKLRRLLPGGIVTAVFATFYGSPSEGQRTLGSGRLRPDPSVPSRDAQRPSRQRLTLRVRIVAALMGITFIPLLVTTIGGIQLARASLIRQGDQTLYSRALARANQIDAYLTSARSSMLAARTQLATRYQSYLATSDPTAQQVALLDMRTTLHTATYNARGQSTALVDTTGRVVVSDLAADSGNELAASPAVRSALTGSTTISGVAYSPTAPPDQQATVELAAPVYADGSSGQVIGAVRERLSLQQITSWVDEDTIATGGGLLVEPGLGLIVAESGQPGAFFSSLQPLSSDLEQQLIASQQYIPGQDSNQASIPTHAIPGITLSMLQSNGPKQFTAGSLDGKQLTGIRYARVTLSSVPWVYLLATSQATFTAPADNLVLVALIVAAISLIVALVVSMSASWRISRQSVATLTQLQRITQAFAQLSTDQLLTAEEQRRYLDATRSELHNLQQTSGDLSQTMDTAVRAAQTQRRDQMEMQLSGGPSWLNQQTQNAYSAWWRQWREAVFPRLQHQYDVCTNIRQGVQAISQTSLHNRQRSADLYAQATAVDAALARGAFGHASEVAPSSVRRLLSRLRLQNVRAALLGLLVAFGLLPSLIFVGTSSSPLRGNLTSLSDQILLSRARSDASATAALLNRQEQSVISIALPHLYADALASSAGMQSAQQSLMAATPDTTTTTLELVNADTGHVVVASGDTTGQPSVSNLQVFSAARTGMVSFSPVFDDPARQQAWYYIAAPISSLDNTHIAGVALGVFSLSSIWSLQNKLAGAANADSPAYLLMLERSDAIIVADSRQPKGIFTASAALDQAGLKSLWQDGRYPDGKTPPSVKLPELSKSVLQPVTSLAPRRLIGQAGAGQPSSQYWLIPLAGTPWTFVEAQSLPVTTAVADALTRLDLLLSLAVLILATVLALVLGRSVSAPLQWLQENLRELTQHLIKIAYRYREQIERQEQALPPIDTTVHALSVETDEVVMILFASPRGPSQPSSAGAFGQGSPQYSPTNASPWPTPWSNPASAVGSQPQLSQSGGSGASWPSTGPLTSMDQPPTIDHLQRVQALASGWKRRQQRISFNLVVAINATDDNRRVSREGQEAARELVNASAQLLNSAL